MVKRKKGGTRELLPIIERIPTPDKTILKIVNSLKGYLNDSTIIPDETILKHFKQVVETLSLAKDIISSTDQDNQNIIKKSR